MEKLKIYYIVFLSLFIIYGCKSQTEYIKLDLNLSEYMKVATSITKDRYNYTKSLEDDKDFWKSFDAIPLTKKVEFEELNLYSIPVFQLKNKTAFSCDENIINHIDFSNNYYNQVIVIEYENFIIDIIYPSNYSEINSENIELRKYDALKYGKYKDEIIIGSQSRFLINLERFEKKYFRFEIEGFEGSFVLKNNKIYYVDFEMHISKNQWIQMTEGNISHKELLNSYTLIFHEINNYIHEKIGKNVINYIQVDSDLKSKKFKKEKCSKKYKRNYLVSLKNE